MQEYRCRFVKPALSEWKTIKSEEADWRFVALEFHDRSSSTGIHHVIRHPDERREDVRFALIEVEGHEAVVTRMFSKGICRRGGIRNDGPGLPAIAQQFGWTHPPEELLGTDWEGEGEYPTF